MDHNDAELLASQINELLLICRNSPYLFKSCLLKISFVSLETRNALKIPWNTILFGLGVVFFYDCEPKGRSIKINTDFLKPGNIRATYSPSTPKTSVKE